MSTGVLIGAHRPPDYGVVVSVGINITTAMLLVDYAVHGLTTPTPWAGAMAGRLPRAVRRRLDDVRAFLGHGAVVRDFLCAQLSADAVEHREWPAFRAWLAEMPVGPLEAMIDAGILTNLDYHRDNEPSPEVRDLLARIPRTEAGLPDFTVPRAREAALRAVIAGWGVPRPAVALRLALDPGGVRSAVIEILDALWDGGFGEDWTAARPALIRLADEAEARLGQSEALPPPARVAWITGLQPDADIAALLRGADRVVFAPCLHLGGYLSILGAAADRFVLFDPQPAHPAPGAEVRPSAQALDLAALGPALEALGDATRLAIMLRMRERGELNAQQVAEEVGVHQSTVSRHLGRLEQAEMLWIRREGGVRHYRVNEDRIRHVADMLRRALVRGEDAEGRG